MTDDNPKSVLEPWGWRGRGGLAWRRRRWGAAWMLSFAVAAVALEPTTPLANYGRQAWVMENGLPQNTVQALAQTRDGYLWIGTEVGLVRFDGSGFQVFDTHSKPALPGNDVRCLLATDHGTLWIGTGDGLARWKNGTATTYTTQSGLPSNNVLDLRWIPTETLLIDTDRGQGEWTAGQIVNGGNSQARPRTAIPSGGTGGGIEFSERLSDRRFMFSDRETLTILEKDPATVYKGQEVAKPILQFRVGNELPGTRIQAVFKDRENMLWIGTNRGLVRWAGGKLDRLPITDPLASASILSLMEDREGNLWAGTESDGLHILRDQRFRIFGTREGLTSDATTTVVEGANGKIWVGTNGGGLNAIERSGGVTGAVRAYSVRDVLLSDVILSLAAAPNGDLWVGTPDGLNRIRGSAVDAYTSADGLPDDFIRSLLVDGDGSLWIGTRHGLAHLTGSPAHIQLETFTQANGLGSDLVGAMARDSRGDLWVATFAGLSRLTHGKIVNYTTADGLSSNVITAITVDHAGALLVGTQDKGWDEWDGARFAADAQSSAQGAAIHAILDDGHWHLWFATGDGLARCGLFTPTRNLLQADCGHLVAFGTADGLRSRETAINSHPSAWRSHDGHLWFATPKGLVEVDPEHFPINGIPPPVAIERFTVDDVDQALHPGGTLEVGAGHVHFQFDYAAMSFVAPQKVRYRYKLEGFDRDWTDAGPRRAAYYTAIPHGHYTFRVQAANNDGDWNLEGAALKFDLRPHFYQTVWFYILLLAASAGLVLLLMRLRVRRVEREFRAVMGERNRIAREIHDTLAQGYVGISVQLELLAELLRLKKVDAAAAHLDTTRGYVREGLADARQSIWALRSQDTGENTLPVRLRRMVEAARGHGLEAACNIHGAYRPLPPGTEREFLRVAQEALHNVHKHAQAKHVTVELEYRAATIALEVRDDGRGFAVNDELAAVLERDGPGHYGLTGMRERAAAVGGTLEVSSEPGAGTAVRLEMPAPREQRENT